MELYHYAISKNILAEVKESIPEALAAINQQDIVCICGSLYLIGEVKAYLSEKGSEKVAAIERIKIDNVKGKACSQI